MTPSVFDTDLLVEIGLTADLLNEIEQQRKRVGNRRGALTRTGADSDGEFRGHGYREDSYPVLLLDAYLDELAVQEARMVKALEKTMKRHPLASWIAAQRGLGLKQLGRLLATLEDPSWHPVEERPRTLDELTAYCGLVPGYRRARGVPADEVPQWNAEARMRVYLIANQVVKMLRPECKVVAEDGSYTVRHTVTCPCGAYRRLYDERKAFKRDAMHTVDCVRCGPSGHPALTGSPWSDAHRHGDALRYVGKRILRDLYREARRANGYPDEVVTAA
jgi:hypothetical protein